MNIKIYFLLVGLLINVSTVKTAGGDDSRDQSSTPSILMPVECLGILSSEDDQKVILDHVRFGELRKKIDISLLISGLSNYEERVRKWLNENPEHVQVNQSFSPESVFGFEREIMDNAEQGISDDVEISFQDRGYYQALIMDIHPRGLSIKAFTAKNTPDSISLTIAPDCRVCNQACKMEESHCRPTFGCLPSEEIKKIFKKFGQKTIYLQNNVKQASPGEKKDVSTSTFKTKFFKYVGIGGLAGLGIWGTVKLAKKTTLGNSYLNSFSSFNLNSLTSKASAILPSAAWSGTKDLFNFWPTR